MGVTPLTSAPQAFQVVELPRSRGENVDDKVHVVEKDPFAFRKSFDVQRTHTAFLQFLFDVFSNCLILTRRSSGAEKKVIGEGADSSKLNHHGVLSLFVERRFYSFG